MPNADSATERSIGPVETRSQNRADTDRAEKHGSNYLRPNHQRRRWNRKSRKNLILRSIPLVSFYRRGSRYIGGQRGSRRRQIAI